jgi:hypothetical protein
MQDALIKQELIFQPGLCKSSLPKGHIVDKPRIYAIALLIIPRYGWAYGEVISYFWAKPGLYLTPNPALQRPPI